jgi:uncharacterized protein YecE (DUF72 family)
MIKFGTCSWRYKSWEGLIYPEFGEYNFLEEYSKHYDTVEIDQWFWSLGAKGAKLPDTRTVEEYKESVPNDFKFTVKAPNSLTLTHHYKSNRPNTFFLEPDLYYSFIERLKPIQKKIELLMFQFEYLNKQKMSSLNQFIDKFSKFHSTVKPEIPFGIEIRNPNYLSDTYFSFLHDLNISQVFIEGYYMPSAVDVYTKYKAKLNGISVLRLQGTGRKEIEEKTKGIWNKIVFPKDESLTRIAEVLKDFTTSKKKMIVNVNNHYEGSAPITIEKIKKLLNS